MAVAFGEEHDVNRRVRWCWHAALVAVITTGLISVAVDPAQAATAETSGPGDGASPSWSGDLDYPVTPQPQEAAPADALSPLAQQLIEAQSSTERLGEQLKSVADELAAAMGATAPRREAWEGADAKARALRAKAADITSQAYMNAMAMGPLRGYAGDLQDLSLLAPGLQAQAQGGGAAGAAARPQERDSIGTEVAAAERDEAAAKADLDAAVAAESEIAGRQTVLIEQFQRSQNALTVLQTRNAGQFAALDADRDAYENSLSASRGLGLTVNGMRAAPAALCRGRVRAQQEGPAVRMGRRGSRLVRLLGVGHDRLPLGRGAAAAGRGRPVPDRRMSVPVSELLPGDLLYFSTDRADAEQDPPRHHVHRQRHGRARTVHRRERSRSRRSGGPSSSAPSDWSRRFPARPRRRWRSPPRRSPRPRPRCRRPPRARAPARVRLPARARVLVPAPARVSLPARARARLPAPARACLRARARVRLRVDEPEF